MDRREFIASTMGMAATLSVINSVSGCGSTEGAGGYTGLRDATTDQDLANKLLTGTEFILDMQTHHIDDEQHWRLTHPEQTYIGNAIASYLTSYACPELQTNPSSA